MLEKEKEMKRRGMGMEGGELFDKVKGYYERRPKDNPPPFFASWPLKLCLVRQIAKMFFP